MKFAKILPKTLLNNVPKESPEEITKKLRIKLYKSCQRDSPYMDAEILHPTDEEEN